MKKIIKKIAVLCFWIILWAGIAIALNKKLLIALPTPWSTAQALIRLIPEPSFYLSIGLSLFRIVVGFAAAVVLGIVSAACSHRLKIFSEITAPAIRCLRAVPVASFIILIFLWFDKSVIPTIIAALMVLPVIWDNMIAALNNIDRSLIEMAEVMDLPKQKIFTKIIWPSIKPMCAAALVSGQGIAWKAGVSAEVICRTDNSLGNLLWIEKNAIAYDEVFAITLVIIVLSVAIEALLKRRLLKQH